MSCILHSFASYLCLLIYFKPTFPFLFSTVPFRCPQNYKNFLLIQIYIFLFLSPLSILYFLFLLISSVLGFSVFSTLGIAFIFLIKLSLLKEGTIVLTKKVLLSSFIPTSTSVKYPDYRFATLLTVDCRG